MQNKGLVRLFAIILSVVCLYQLSFTWFAKNVEKEAAIYAESTATTSDSEELGRLEKKYLDSVANTPVVNLGFTEFTYDEVKEKEINQLIRVVIQPTLHISLEFIFMCFSFRIFSTSCYHWFVLGEFGCFVIGLVIQ